MKNRGRGGGQFCIKSIIMYTGFYKIKKSIFQLKYAIYEKILNSRIAHLKEIHKLYSDHFFIKHTVFVLIVINTIKDQTLNFLAKIYGVWKNVTNKSCYS